MLSDNLNRKRKILIVEDEPHIAEGVQLNLNLKGYETAIAVDGNKAIDLWKSFSPDLILLDLMLPHRDGLSVLEEIRLTDETLPIMVLSAKYEAQDKVACFEKGVDDYLCKPFHLEEFLLRVDRLLKRTSWSTKSEASVEVTGDQLNDFSFGSNTVCFVQSKANNGNDDFELTHQEAKLLKFFILNKETPLTRQVILESAFGYQNQESVSTRTIDAFIVRFRKYFEMDSKSPVHFKSLRSVGYIFYP